VPPGKAINPSGTQDNEVLFGQVHEQTVTILNTVINSVYKPLIDRLQNDEWGDCEVEAKREFMVTFDKFAREVQEAVKSLNNNITLDPYPADYKQLAQEVLQKGSSNNPKQKEMVDKFEEIFNEWYDKIEANLDETDNEKKDDKEGGPKVELDYWKQKMRKLTCISEQLKSKNCRTVYDVLNQAS
jgi:dynein heavy chain, axonemal